MYVCVSLCKATYYLTNSSYKPNFKLKPPFSEKVGNNRFLSINFTTRLNLFELDDLNKDCPRPLANRVGYVLKKLNVSVVVFRDIAMPCVRKFENKKKYFRNFSLNSLFIA